MTFKRTLKLLIPLVILLFALPAFAQEEVEEEVPTCETPKVLYLVEKTGADCAEILELHAAGIGFGQIMKAVIIANGLESEEMDWREILALREGEEAGWGQISHAFGLAERFSELGLTGPELLALKQTEDIGWGQIVHAQSIAAADLGLSFEEALEMIMSGMGWGEIRDALELPSGPPPWAGQGALKKNKESRETGPPPEVQAKHEERGNGPPPWAGPKNGSDDGETVEPAENSGAKPGNSQGNNGNSNGNSQGNNGNGNGNSQGNNGNGNGNGNKKDK